MIVLPRYLLKAMDAAGVGTAALARAVGLSPERLAGELNPEEADRFLGAAWRALDDPGFGLKSGGTLRPELFGVAGFCALMSPTLGAALGRLVRYSRLVLGDEFEMVRRDGETTLRVEAGGPVRPYSRAKIDGELASKCAFAREMTSVQVNPVRLRIKGPPPSYASDYAGVFRCPIHFDEDEDSITFRNEDLELKLLSANPEICKLFEAHAEEVLALRGASSTEQRVRSALRQVLRGDVPTLGAVASEMCMSTRTLQRKLSESGLSFSRLVGTTRQELAQQYVRQNRASLAEIAYMLGFADPQSFFRAFKRWTGTTPGNYRRPGSDLDPTGFLVPALADPPESPVHYLVSETPDMP